jgi:UDPglucose--hexose-1-phosphate uridylyltransferase
MSKFRQNPITKEWTIISTERSKRPLLVGPKSAAESASGGCPFCPGNEEMTGPDVYHLDGVRVIPNKYPITDFHEVIIHSPNHEKDFESLPLGQIELVLRTYKERYNFYKEKRGDFYIHIYNNSGKEAGASLKHPHSQLVVFNQIPPDVAEETTGAKDFFDRKSACPYCDLIKNEISSQERVVIDSELFLVLTPFQSEWPYEISLLPKKHQADFGLISDEEVADLAATLQQTLRAYKKVLSNPAYNFWIHSLPLRASEPEAQYYHWHLDLIPRIKTLGGLELGAGIMVDDRVGPEEAARQLRQSL